MRAFAIAGLVAASASMIVLAACASDDPAEGGEPPKADAGPTTDAGGDAADVDLGACDDCDDFPETCTPDVLCPTPVLDSRYRVHVIRGRSPDDIWAGGAHGTLLHFDGTSWRPSNVGTIETIRSLWLRASSEVSFVSLGSIYTRGMAIPDAGSPSADGWTAQGAPPGPFAYKNSLQLEGTWALPGTEWLWCATMYELAFIFPQGGSGLWRLHVSPETNAFEVAQAIPAGICGTYPCASMTSVHGASADVVWAVGLEGAAFRITNAQGETPEIEQLNSQTWNTIYGVWAASDDDVWAVGGAGLIRHYTGDGRNYDIVDDVPTTESLRAVWGASASDVWAVGDHGVALHYDGERWSRVKIAGVGKRRPDLFSVWMPSPGHVWIGGDGVLLSVGGKP